MELIQALEQLSLEVKSKQNFEAQNGPTDWRRPIRSESMKLYNPTNPHMSTITDSDGPQAPLRQLEEFDDSIETLFAQLSEFEPTDLQPSYNQRPTVLGAPVRRCHFRDSRLGPAASMETSQEEDSDCSSQQSSQLLGSTNICPLVRDLLKRDLSAITDTVRKISRILALGKEIESVYTHLTSSRSYADHQSRESGSLTAHDQLHPDYQLGRSLNQANQARVIDPTYLRSLCDTYTHLYLSEPHMVNLQTMLRYNECCQRLMSLLGFQPNHRPGALESVQMDSDDVKGEEDEDEGELFAEDVAFLDCDPRRMNNWTENKLYANHK